MSRRAGTADASSSTLKTGKWGGAVDASRADFEAQRDYLTQDEARKMFRKKEKKAKKARKALAAPIPQNTGSVLDGLDDVDEGGERGSRATKVHKDGSAADAARRAANWDAAQRRAQEKGDVGLGKISKADVAGAAPSRSAAPMEVDVSEAAPKPSSKFVAGLGDDDDDAELRAALDRARATAVARPPEGEAAAAAIAARVKTEAAAAEDDAGATDARGPRRRISLPAGRSRGRGWRRDSPIHLSAAAAAPRLCLRGRSADNGPASSRRRPRRREAPNLSTRPRREETRAPPPRGDPRFDAGARLHVDDRVHRATSSAPRGARGGEGRSGGGGGAARRRGGVGGGRRGHVGGFRLGRRRRRTRAEIRSAFCPSLQEDGARVPTLQTCGFLS